MIIEKHSKVYAVIVTYNGAKWIEKCLRSLLYSSVKMNIIVLDNNSSDDTCEIVKDNFPGVQLIAGKKNLGFGAANNIGMKLAYDDDADFVVLVNQDVYFERETLRMLIGAQANNPDYDLISPVHLNGDGSKLDYNFSNYIVPNSCPNFISDIYMGRINRIYDINFINAACWLMTRKCIGTVGGFSPAFFHYGEDNNYLDRCKFHHIKYGVHGLSRIFHDRENEIKELKNVDEWKRTKMVDYLNPNNDFLMERDLRLLKNKYVKLKLKMYFRYSRVVKREIEFYKREIPRIEPLYMESKKKGLTFL